MSDPDSCLYLGEVIHQRFAPRRHRLRYRMFQMLFYLDELPSLARRLKLFSYNEFNAFSFHDADHGDGDGAGGSLRAYVDRVLAKAGLVVSGGRVALLCMPRLFGHVFNPISIYYCFDADKNLVAMIYEVNNTFGQRHTYLIPVDKTIDGTVKQSCAKGFYVSPFMSMDMNYDFKLTRPGGTIATVVNGSNSAGEPLIFAAFTGQRREFTDRALLAALFAYPFLTLGVVVAIHWEALKLFFKGIRLRDRPTPPSTNLTVVGPSASPHNAAA
jgi:DUF1365 family protein